MKQLQPSRKRWLDPQNLHPALKAPAAKRADTIWTAP